MSNYESNISQIRSSTVGFMWVVCICYLGESEAEIERRGRGRVGVQGSGSKEIGLDLCNWLCTSSSWLKLVYLTLARIQVINSGASYILTKLENIFYINSSLEYFGLQIAYRILGPKENFFLNAGVNVGELLTSTSSIRYISYLLESVR